MGLGMSLRILPGVRISASTSGIRASVGPRAARIHAGTGKTAVSSGFGPFSMSASTGTARKSTSNRKRPTSKPQVRKKKAEPSSLDTLGDALNLVVGIFQLMEVVSDIHEAKQASKQAAKLLADSEQAAQLLTSLHLENFTGPAKPTAPQRQEVTRKWANFWVSNDDDIAANEAAFAERRTQYQQELASWKLLQAHDPLEVIAVVDEALADNASQSTCIDAGFAEAGNYVTVVVHYPGLEITEGIVRTGWKSRPRNETEKIALYRSALASTVIATAKEALAFAPAADEVYVVVLGYDLRKRAAHTPADIDAIYAGAFGRPVLDTKWKTDPEVSTGKDPLDAVLGARAVRINLDRKGRIQTLGKNAGDDLRSLVDKLRQAQSVQQPARPSFTRDQSLALMRAQQPEPFVALCPCPGCGNLEAHHLREPIPGEPSWATTIRTCAACNRQWAQS